MSDLNPNLISVYVRGIRLEAEGIRSFELWPHENIKLPVARAGDHIDVHLPAGLIRQYSLINTGDDRRYIIGVNQDLKSRGGSRHMHEGVRVGDRLQISAPRNHFELEERATETVLVAGGIGITPLYAMARRLIELDRRFTLYYSARSRNRAAFLDDLRHLVRGKPDAALQTVFDDESGVASLDPNAVVARHPGAHLYCCGPVPLMDAFVRACESVEPARVHLEYFGGTPLPAAPADAANPAKGFVVRLARSGRELEVTPDVSILGTLLNNGVTVLNSCREGVCGSCETAVLEGTPEHRDCVLSPAERAANNTMMVCVSRCQGASLTLDI
ncbi:PDR/VanB family oxidoreductase [Variovorax dokdonensis]|uniref:PDR/VanB family oxidoreductase n=1 Tax=Variovorax dokdonensis TaxID=344883 RepID=A0ABT7NE13_9BURK|nr:PDR/VanB family oxidoreductase [Variovorax dokdonensis]MDM0046178.1 PDR/VanB family oxidoreductase [Variovorax dokdonensis]